MKHLIAVTLLLFSLNSHADQILINCEVSAYVGPALIHTEELKTFDGFSLEADFHNVHYSVQSTSDALMYLITDKDGMELTGVVPAPTKDAPFVFNFNHKIGHELRCFLK